MRMNNDGVEFLRQLGLSFLSVRGSSSVRPRKARQLGRQEVAGPGELRAQDEPGRVREDDQLQHEGIEPDLINGLLLFSGLHRPCLNSPLHGHTFPGVIFNVTRCGGCLVVNRVGSCP